MARKIGRKERAMNLVIEERGKGMKLVRELGLDTLSDDAVTKGVAEEQP